jgi:hypothetical protein
MDLITTRTQTSTKSALGPVFQFAGVIALAVVAASPAAWAKKHSSPAHPPDSGYVAALAVANRFLAAWQSNDQAAAMPLITTRAKQQSTEEGIDKLFDGSPVRAFEITRGRASRQDRYQFSVILLQADDSGRTRRRFADLTILNTGKNDWAVDKLP